MFVLIIILIIVINIQTFHQPDGTIFAGADKYLLLSISLLLTTTNYLSAPANIAPPGWRTDYINLMFMNERK